MRPLLIMLAALLCSASASSQTASTEPDLISQLNHQPLLLRGLFAGEKLAFDRDGKLIGRAATTSPMLSAIDIADTELTRDRVILKGHRQGIVFYERNPERNNLSDISIEIEKPANGDYSIPLAAIFTQSFADLAPAAPDFWQRFLRHSEEKQADRTELKSGDNLEGSGEPAVRRVGGSVLPPRVLSSGQPDFTDEARKLKVNGKTVIALNVSAEGIPKKIQIVRPVGAGLDEGAVAVVREYRFKPATENGSPVAVRITIEISFKTF